MPDVLHLFRCGAAEVIPLRALSPGEAASYRKAVEHLREFDKSPAYLELVARNQGELDQSMSVWQSTAEALCKDRTYRDHQELEFNRRFVNYLASARLLLDHYETRLKRRYGDDSLQAKGFKTECAASYDNQFAYRFLYRLRNFAQHFGMPAGHVQTRSYLESPNSSKTIYEASIQLDVGDLLTRGGDMWGKIAAELEAKGALLDVQPQVSTMTGELNRIVSRTQILERPNLLETGKTLVGIVGDAVGPGLTPGVGLMQDAPPHTTIQFLQPPFRLMQWLGFGGFENPI